MTSQSRSAKLRRQRRIAEILETHEVTSQAQVVELLATEGYPATQATVSRDLEELGAVKVRLPDRGSVYAIVEPPERRPTSGGELRRVLSEWALDVGRSGPIIVVRTPPGCAHVVAAALDRRGDPRVLGTVAGDDTVLVVAREGDDPATLEAWLRELAGLSASGPAAGRRRARGRWRGRSEGSEDGQARGARL
jgi:transcriptional regulator of arginine metabolism